MTTADWIHYHRTRAEQERARARQATCAVAAGAHVALAELHEQRLRVLADEQATRPKLHAAFAKAG